MEVLQRRHASDTLGFNKCRPDEAKYATRCLVETLPGGVDAAQQPLLHARASAVVTTNASCFGVHVAFLLAGLCLCRLHSRGFGVLLPPLSPPERVQAEQIVFLALDDLASARAVTIPILGEAALVHAVQETLALPVTEEPSFRAALEARWTSPAVMASLRMRGTVERTTALPNAMAAWEAARRADVAEHGLLVCALLGCDKKEVTVREFKVSSACRAVAYCSAEHAGLHWARGHKHECKELKAAGAKPARAI